MHYAFYTEQELAVYPIALLTSFLQPTEIRKAYIDPYGMYADDIIILDLLQDHTKKKTPASLIKQYIVEELIPALINVQAQYLIVTDAEYFKVLTRKPQAELFLGYVVDCVYGPWKVVYAPSHRSIFYDPVKTTAKIGQAVVAMKQHVLATYVPPGSNIIHSASYPSSPDDILAWLLELHKHPVLTCDIETFSLKPPTSGIGTITFCWNQHEGVAFAVDLLDPDGATKVRAGLKEFFETYQGKIIYHRATFDIHILIYQLFMTDLLDTAGLLYGLEIMMRDWECSQIITYLATNSCARNELGLKKQAREFAGNYAKEDIKNIRVVPLPELLEYNLIDGLATWFVFNKNHPIMIADQQEDVYQNIFKPAAMDIVQMQLTGLPVDIKKVAHARKVLERDEQKALAKITGVRLVNRYTHRLNAQWVIKKNSELKIKRVSLADANETFNPNSAPQLQDLLYKFLALPEIATTDTGLPSTDQDTLAALKNHTSDPEVIDLLDGIIEFKAVNKILTAVIPALEGAFLAPDGWHYVLGNFNIGGTLSGRLSSSEPNLQNLPATGTKYAKLIKQCFVAPPGWIFVGLDFDSLEDKISALTTKDPNKIKVYTDGYDGHSLRAYAYFGQHMPDIDPNDVQSINSIEKKYKPYRQNSKAPTFALTYQGTKNTLMVNCGFSPQLAQEIFDKYHEMYAVSDQWVNAQLAQASKVGYVTVAFGLRLRTPLLAQTIRGTRKTPYEAEAEGRTAGNALGQSWCLLNNRAASEFMSQARKSPYRLDIRPGAQIHDAQYYLIRDDIDTLLYTNDKLIKAVSWQQDPLIAHPAVKLSGKLLIFHPDWSVENPIPNNATKSEIFSIIDDLPT